MKILENELRGKTVMSEGHLVFPFNSIKSVKDVIILGG